jgi:Serine hydrolase (FSH1)
MATQTNSANSKTPSKAILCLHGSSTSAAIFRFQLAKLRLALKSQFEFIFVNAPNPAIAGPGILLLFGGAGPFYRWFDLESGEWEVEIDSIHTAVRGAVNVWESTKKNQSSRIVAIMAFSRVAIAATLLLWQKQQGQLPWLPAMHFAVLICCDFTVELAVHMHGDAKGHGEERAVLCLPTLHLHGRQDPFLKRGRKMGMDHFNVEEAEVLEFEGGHQCPSPRQDCEEATRCILELSGVTVGKAEDS